MTPSSVPPAVPPTFDPDEDCPGVCLDCGAVAGEDGEPPTLTDLDVQGCPARTLGRKR